MLHLVTRKRAAAHVHLHGLDLGPDVKVENVHRQPQSRARVGDVHDAGNVALDRRGAEQQVDLVIVVAVAAEVLDGPEAGLAVGDRRVEVVLLAVLVDREALEGEIPAWTEVWLHGTGEVHGGLEAHLRHAVLDHGELDRDDARHLDGTAEGDLAVSLGEVQVSNGEFRAGDMHGQVYFRSSA